MVRPPPRRSARNSAAVAKLAAIDYEAVWSVKSIALQYRFAAFLRARAARAAEPLFAEFDAFRRRGRREPVPLRHVRGDPARAQRRILAPLAGGTARRRPGRARRQGGAARLRRAVLRILPMARRPAARAAAAERARAAGLEIGLYRDLAVGSAPDGAESWSRAAELGIGASVGAPPDPFSASGQNWHLPPLDPVAGARTGWKGFRDLLARQHAPRRHAADRPRDGADAAVRHPRGREAVGRRLCRLSRRRNDRADRAARASANSAWSSARTSAPCPTVSATS